MCLCGAGRGSERVVLAARLLGRLLTCHMWPEVTWEVTCDTLNPVCALNFNRSALRNQCPRSWPQSQLIDSLMPILTENFHLPEIWTKSAKFFETLKEEKLNHINEI